LAGGVGRGGGALAGGPPPPPPHPPTPNPQSPIPNFFIILKIYYNKIKIIIKSKFILKF